MLVTGIVCPVALVFILLADRLALSVAALVAAAAIAGAFAPPVTVLTRTVWRYRFDDPAERKTAFALDAVLIELAFTLGPVLVAVLLAIASPRVAFTAALLLVALAVPVFALSPALKYWRHQPGVERRLLGPLADPRLLAVYAVTFLLMFSLGLLEIGYAGFATAALHAGVRGHPDRDQFDRQRHRRPALWRRAARDAGRAAVAPITAAGRAAAGGACGDELAVAAGRAGAGRR